jgi:hypothetical protein
MAIAKKVKFRKDDKEQLDLGTRILVAAYRFSKKTNHRIDAVKKSTRKLGPRERAELPEDSAIDGHLKKLIEFIEAGKSPEDENFGYQIVIKNAYQEITGGQVNMNEIEAQDAVSVPALAPQEDVASQCDEKQEEDEKAEEKPAKSEKAERMHHFAVSHTALVMGRIQMQCKSWHLEMGEVTMAMPYDVWYDICLHYGVTEEVAEWASRS